MLHFVRTVAVLCAVLAGLLDNGPSLAATKPRPCNAVQQRALLRVVSRFSRALIRDDMETVNRLLTPALRARTHMPLVRRSIHPRTEQAALSFMLLGPDRSGTPAKPFSFRFPPGWIECSGAKPLQANVWVFYRWPGAALSVVTLVQTIAGWRIAGLRLAQV